MKCICLKENIREALSAVEHGTGDSNALPILKNVLIATEGGKLRVATTNLELGITKFLQAKIIEEGGVSVSLTTLLSIVANSDSERISLQTDAHNLLVQTDNYQARIQGMPREEFPIIPKIENQDCSIEFSTHVLKEAMGSVMGSAQISEIRPELSGVLLVTDGSSVKFVATDSFRLAEKTLIGKQFKTSMQKGVQCIIPLKTAQEVMRIFKDDDAVLMQVDVNQIVFKNQQQEIISRLIDGRYPEYEQIIPKTNETELSVSKEKLISAVKLVSSFSGKANDIKMSVQEGGKTLAVFSASQSLGENTYLIPIKCKGAEFKNVSFNWRFVLDGLRVITGDQITFLVNGDTKPAVIKATEDVSYFYLVMPIKV